MQKELTRRLELIKDYFIVPEFVTRECWELLGDHALLLFDPVILEFITRVRSEIGLPIHVNTWIFGGAIDGRGFRDRKEDTGSKGSMHRFGKALDFCVQGCPAEDVREWILQNQQTLPNITRMEKGVSWVHVDTRETQTPHEIYLFNP